MLEKSSKVKRECFVSENVDELDKPYVRSKVCQSLPVKYEKEGKYYCLLHYPNFDKAEEFEKEFEKRLSAKDYDFKGVYFPTLVSLFSKSFQNHVNFHSATFTKGIRISSTSFSEPVDFIGAVFIGDSYFYEVTFSKYVSFHAATFSEDSDISFRNIRFEKEIDFDYTIFRGYLILDGEQNNLMFGANAYINLQNARIEKPERVTFHKLKLKPSWFINADCRKLVFSHCSWYQADGKYVDAKSELKELIKREIPNPNKLLRKTCWQLADNYEENKNFYTASLFRQIANEAKRLDLNKGFKIWSLHWWYWLSSFYGESWPQAIAVLFVILFGFSLIYTQTEFQICPINRPLAMSVGECEKEAENCKCRNGGLKIGEAFTHSIATALFQNVEYRKPLTIWSELATYLEKIFAPLQAALLALAIRRKFMR